MKVSMKKTALFSILSVFLLFSPGLVTSASSAVSYVGMITSVSGTVEIGRSGSARAVPAKLGDSLFAGDNVKTRAGSMAQITLRDNSKVVVAENTSMRVSKFTLNRKTERRNTLLNLFRGKIRVLAMKMIRLTSSGARRPWRNANFTVKTPTAVVGVKGTEFIISTDVAANKKFTNLIVVDGLVEARGIDSKGRLGGVVLVGRMQQTGIGADGIPSEPVEMPSEGVMRMVENMTPKPGDVTELAKKPVGEGETPPPGEGDGDEPPPPDEEPLLPPPDEEQLLLPPDDQGMLVLEGGGGVSCVSPALPGSGC